MKAFFRVILMLSIAVSIGSWGFFVHRIVGQLAMYQLPKKMRPFFYENINYIDKEIVQPDLRRNSDSFEVPKHFIDLERYGDSAAWKMPLKWDDAVRIYTRDSLMKNGYVPYQVMMSKEKLTQAFRDHNKDSILFYAADLGHYIGDANVPLHCTENYDGQLTNQKGIHNFWETLVPAVEINHNNYNLYDGHHARYLDHPEETIWGAIRNAYALVNDLLEKEKEVSKDFPDSSKYEVQVHNGKEFKGYSSKFAIAYGKALGNTVNERLLRSADMIADFWYTSWVDAGRPDLNSLIVPPFTKEAKKELKLECKAYKKNQLVEKNLLLVRKKQ